jgi:hypothetical protein
VWRRRVGAGLLALAVLFALGSGLWGTLNPSAGSPVPVGEAVEVSGGEFRVAAVLPEHMEHMQAGRFAGADMGGMAGMGVDMTPEGYRRLTVEVTLAAGEEPIRYARERFRVSGPELAETPPMRGELAEGVVPAGSAVSGVLVFQVPKETAGELYLNFDGSRSVDLIAPAGPGSPLPDRPHGHR